MASDTIKCQALADAAHNRILVLDSLLEQDIPEIAKVLIEEFGVASVSLRSAKKRHPGLISARPHGWVWEMGGERKLASQPQPEAAMAC